MKVLAKNKRGHYDYQITEKLVAGLVLSGAEVKSIKAGHASLKGSFISFQNNEAFLSSAHVTPYNYAGNKAGLDPERNRKLLLHRRQLNELMEARTGGLYAVPLTLLEEKSMIKLELGIGPSKKNYDKRQAIKKRDTEREVRRELKS